jgi:predicted ATP-grasp superfamily ATP-dependent carboligase
MPTTPPERDAGNGPPALIVGDDQVNVLGLARNLGREGVRVHRLGAGDAPVLRSRYIRSLQVVPGIDDSPDGAFVAAVERAARGTRSQPVLFPASDLHVIRIARNAEALAESCLLLAANLPATETLVNKRRFYESLADTGVAHPATRFPRTRDEFEAAASAISYPVLIKPEISPLFARRFQQKGFVAHSREELHRHLETLQSSGLAMMAQEIIPGGADCMHGCAGLRTADRLLVFCYRRVREFPEGFGSGSLLESVPPFVAETRLVEYLGQLGYTGIFDAEFKRDPRDGVYKMIEINARSWWQNTHPSISGLNIVKAAYDYAAGRPVSSGSYQVGTKWVHLYNDYFAARAAGLGLLAWKRSLRGRTAFDVWARDDRRPMLAFLLGIARGRAQKALGFRAATR